MHFDLRYPIGLLLTTYGGILVLQGVFVGASVLGLNVNLYWGAIMMACGLGMLYFARRKTLMQRRSAVSSRNASVP
jgi:hypothetical protein